ncbi:50S ribosomal protein L18 [Desulfurobacterium atlanticum]|uniref:Large ribosomal subunit protein uL18 n=1 Tax=Desulfurobacterium atlanticum TaxID=240169 RepID=A0A238ZR58_9BACT|nr:50S ribosomal protein L18 [Desulfurobacterium atlanticum]SNR85133.1 LSU ribosomal protein L18P [Desulfurobacterium atlanticum]
MAKMTRKERILRKHRRVRKKVFGTSERPRLAVYKSLKHMHAQIIDDTKGITLVSASTVEKEIKEKVKGLTKTEAAKVVGQVIAERAKEKGIKAVVFDRGGFIYHGRIKAVAEGAREGGLEF